MGEKPMEPEAREVTGGAMLFGTPIAYIAIWAAIDAVAGVIPFSFVVGAAGSFPVRLGLMGLTAVALGPIPGALAMVVACLINWVISPYTTGSYENAIFDGLATLCTGWLIGENKLMKVVAILVAVASYAFSSLMFVVTGLNIRPTGPDFVSIWLPGVTDAAPAILMAIVTFPFLRSWLKSESPVKLAIGLVVVAYFPFAIQHMIGWGLFTLRYNFPMDGSIYIAFYFTWWERLSLATVGIVVGFFVIIALRQIGLAKPRDAAY